MPVPEAAVYEDDGSQPREHDIGFSGQPLFVQPEAEAERMGGFANGHLGACIARPHARHHIGPPRGRKPVHGLAVGHVVAVFVFVTNAFPQGSVTGRQRSRIELTSEFGMLPRR